MYCTFNKQFFLSTMYGPSSSLLYSSLKSRDHHFAVVNYMYHKYHNCYLNIEHVSRQMQKMYYTSCLVDTAGKYEFNIHIPIFTIYSNLIFAVQNTSLSLHVYCIHFRCATSLLQLFRIHKFRTASGNIGFKGNHYQSS